mgnify:CR=1 FL=1|tara:strand:- start:675 stop:1121 length:447 start_codon:yes stop_codon:yes gene_type:complete
MKIKHKQTNIERNLSFADWIREYVRKELDKDWEILNLNDVVKVKTLHKDGKVSITLMSKSQANNHKRQFSTTTSILKDKVKMEFYEDYLKTKILKNHLSLRKKSWYNLPAIKAKLEIITKSKISKEAWFMIRGIVIIVIASIIIAALK